MATQLAGRLSQVNALDQNGRTSQPIISFLAWLIFYRVKSDNLWLFVATQVHSDDSVWKSSCFKDLHEFRRDTFFVTSISQLAFFFLSLHLLSLLFSFFFFFPPHLLNHSLVTTFLNNIFTNCASSPPAYSSSSFCIHSLTLFATVSCHIFKTMAARQCSCDKMSILRNTREWVVSSGR